MPSRLQMQFKTQQMPSMVGYIKPPTIKMKQAKTKYRIDGSTLRMWEVDEPDQDQDQDQEEIPIQNQ